VAGTGASADAMTAPDPADHVWTYALNLSTVFTGLPFLERLDAAAAAGFAAVEFWWPREEFRSGLTPKALVTRVLDVGIGVALMNFDGGDLGAGERGFAGVPGRDETFRRGVPMALDLADQLTCHRLHALAGRRAPGHRLEDQVRLLESSLAFAADLAPAGTIITLEVLNSTDVPGYLVPDSRSALALIDRVGRRNLGLQLDVYHLAMEGEDPAEVIRQAGGRIAHVQFADAPGRHEPGTGSVPFRSILRALGAVGYRGAIGLEYIPSRPETPDFAFLETLAAPPGGPLGPGLSA
jgi:hydroxypyruvate isomerase